MRSALAASLSSSLLPGSVAGKVRNLVKKAFEKSNFDPTLAGFVSNTIRWLIILMAILAVLGVFGIETTSFAAVLGAAGLAIGLAFQGSLSNVAAGVMLLIFRPFKLDDVISVSGSLGKVAEIGLFTTALDTPDNRRIIIPNSVVFGSTIENITHHDIRRVDVAVGTEYPAKLSDVRDVLEKVPATIEGGLSEPAPQIYLAELGASSIDWQVRVWCKTADFFSVRQQIVDQTKLALDEAEIGIPFPQMDVHLDK